MLLNGLTLVLGHSYQLLMSVLGISSDLRAREFEITCIKFSSL